MNEEELAIDFVNRPRRIRLAGKEQRNQGALRPVEKPCRKCVMLRKRGPAPLIECVLQPRSGGFLTKPREHHAFILTVFWLPECRSLKLPGVVPVAAIPHLASIGGDGFENLHQILDAGDGPAFGRCSSQLTRFDVDGHVHQAISR